MKKIIALIPLLLSINFNSFSDKKPLQESYPVDPASIKQAGVPEGVITQYKFKDSKIFPGTERDYWIYVPAQYKKETPAALMVFQDGRNFSNEKRPSKMPIVFDNLIHSKEMPVTIAVCINPGVVPVVKEGAQPRYNRSYEYDGMGADYAKFLNEEILPEVEKNYNISQDPNARGISGSSSGAIAAFNAAWYGEDTFRRVYTIVGTFVGLRGGDGLPTLIRKLEPKPIRIFLQDGSNDNNLYGGSWWDMNRAMVGSFKFSGYEMDYEWGEGGHNQKHGAAIFPKAMRYIWKDYPKPVTTHYENSMSKSLKMLIENEKWKLVSEGHGLTEGPAVNEKGDLFFTDLGNSKIHKVNKEGKVSTFVEESGGTNGLAFGPDGLLYGARRDAQQIVAWDANGKMKVVTKGVKPNDLVVSHEGLIYFTEPKTKTLWMVKKDGTRVVADYCGFSCNGVMLSADQSRLFVADYTGRFVYTYQLKADGGVAHKQAYFHLHIPVNGSKSKADGMAVDQSGWLFTATEMGVQISDQPGRVHLILPPPKGSRQITNVTFGGEKWDTLYITCGDGKVFKRKTNLIGALAWKAPVKLNKPRL